MTTTVRERMGAVWASSKVKIVGLAGSAVMLVSSVSAGNITDGISPVIMDVTELLPLMLALVIAALPIIVALAVSFDVKVSRPVNRVCTRIV